MGCLPLTSKTGREKNNNTLRENYWGANTPTIRMYGTTEEYSLGMLKQAVQQGRSEVHGEKNNECHMCGRRRDGEPAVSWAEAYPWGTLRV